MLSSLRRLMGDELDLIKQTNIGKDEIWLWFRDGLGEHGKEIE